MPFPDRTFGDIVRSVPRPAWAGAALLLVLALGATIFGFGACSPEPAFTLSKNGEAASVSEASDDAQKTDAAREESKDASSDDSSSTSGTAEEEGSSVQVAVYVSGAVASPGVYMLDEGARVCDAVAAAGGFRDDAALESVNLARRVADGEQIAIPTQEQVESGAFAAQESAGSAGSAGSAAASSASSSLVNINTAGIEELDSLAGVGPATAQAIVDEREANGPFASVEDIQRVSGIGEKKFEKLKESICV
ncbi:MAG: ComEA family DNA-binding protein [Slackia sp.]|nr:ComEA family DNA-binding protein [Slackia sp.]